MTDALTAERQYAKLLEACHALLMRWEQVADDSEPLACIRKELDRVFDLIH